MAHKTRIISTITLLLLGSNVAHAGSTTWDFNGVVTFCNEFACNFADPPVQVGDSLSGFITANSSPNSTIAPTDVQGFLIVLSDLMADSSDGTVVSSDVQTDANGDFSTGTLVLSGTIANTAEIVLTFDITGGTFMIETDFLGLGVIVAGTGDWAFELDGDGIAAIEDNCTEVFNPDQRDTDADGFGNICDGDFNQDCLVNFNDLLAMRDTFFVMGDLDTDLNGDGITNFSDLQLMQEPFFGPVGPSGVPNICDP